MTLRLAGAALLSLMIAACGGDEAPDNEMAMEEMPAEVEMTATVDVTCSPMLNVMAIEDRASPYDSTSVSLGGETAKVCYNRPSVRGREIFGGLVPYDTLWRTGANEPTTIHLPFPAEIAGIAVEPGSYSLYSVPGEDNWTIIVNRSTSQWGIETAYSPEVRSQEVGRAEVPSEQIEQPVELYTIHTEPNGANAADLMLDWETTRVTIPIERS